MEHDLYVDVVTMKKRELIKDSKKVDERENHGRSER
jgi:hypothetical protein